MTGARSPVLGSRAAGRRRTLNCADMLMCSFPAEGKKGARIQITGTHDRFTHPQQKTGRIWGALQRHSGATEESLPTLMRSPLKRPIVSAASGAKPNQGGIRMNIISSGCQTLHHRLPSQTSRWRRKATARTILPGRNMRPITITTSSSILELSVDHTATVRPTDRAAG